MSCHGEQIEDNDNSNNDDSEEDDDGQGNQVCGRQKGIRACKFRNEDLPGLLGSMAVWCKAFLPCWFQYLSTVDDIWKLDHPEHVKVAQTLWDRMVKVEHNISPCGKPVFSLIGCLLIPTITNLTGS